MKDVNFISILADDSVEYTIHHLGQEVEGVMKALQLFIKLFYSDDMGGFLKLIRRGQNAGSVPRVTRSNLSQIRQYINAGIALTGNEIKKMQDTNIALYGSSYYTDMELFDSCIIKSLDIDEAARELNLILEFRTLGASTEVAL